MKFLPIALFILLAACSETEQNPCGTIPDGAGHTSVRFIQALPNPKGAADDGESFTVKNFGDSIVDLDGWKATNNGGAEWKLDAIGKLAACTHRTYITKTDGAMNNDMDTLKLFDKNSMLVHTISWQDAGDGEIIYAP